MTTVDSSTVAGSARIDPALTAARRYTWLTQLDRHASQMPERTALRFQGSGTTWRELKDRVDWLAAALAERGIG
ncbi:MAG: fatty-acyl-CoA synthase, partial [Frankiaceae bacterium]|nr:fatty-acyl-CoA synthase [Frankiaceae bacterium]